MLFDGFRSFLWYPDWRPSMSPQNVFSESSVLSWTAYKTCWKSSLWQLWSVILWYCRSETNDNTLQSNQVYDFVTNLGDEVRNVSYVVRRLVQNSSSLITSWVLEWHWQKGYFLEVVTHPSRYAPCTFEVRWSLSLSHKSLNETYRS